MVNVLLKTVLVIAALYGGLLALVVFYQPKLVYFPQQGAPDITPRALGLAFERVTIATEDGERLAAWWVPVPADSRGAVLLLHGNAGHIGHRIEYARMFHDMGLATLLVDYRGYGESSGTPSEQGTYRDAAASWAWLTRERGVAAADIVIFGESLGGGVATWLAARQMQQAHQAPRALILASTFTSVPDLGAQVYPWLPVRWLSRIHYDSLARLREIKVPVLIAHSPQDNIIPYSHGRRLFAAANEPKQFLDLAGGHNDGFVFLRAAWRDAVREFLSRRE